MGDEDLLEMAEALEKTEDLTKDDAKFLERTIALLREEKRLSKKDRARLMEMHRDVLGEKEDGSGNEEDIDEDDFV
jgi:hypothetical protein